MAGIAGHDRDDAFQHREDGFRAPEAAAGEDRGLAYFFLFLVSHASLRACFTVRRFLVLREREPWIWTDALLAIVGAVYPVIE